MTVTTPSRAQRVVLDWLKEDAPVVFKMRMMPDDINKLVARMEKEYGKGRI